jgi:hypothetical protein
MPCYRLPSEATKSTVQALDWLNCLTDTIGDGLPIAESAPMRSVAQYLARADDSDRRAASAMSSTEKDHYLHASACWRAIALEARFVEAAVAPGQSVADQGELASPSLLRDGLVAEDSTRCTAEWYAPAAPDRRADTI